MDTVILICCFCLIFIVIFILSIVGVIYVLNNSDNNGIDNNGIDNNGIDTSTDNTINITLPLPSIPPYNTNILIMAPKGVETSISKIIIIDKNDNLVIPKNAYSIKPNQYYFLNGSKKSNPSGQYIIIFEPSIVKAISISGNLKDNLLYLKGNKNDFGIGTLNKLTDSYTQVINYKV